MSYAVPVAAVQRWRQQLREHCERNPEDLRAGRGGRGPRDQVRVTATNADGSTSAESAATSAVAPATSSGAPRMTDRPIISGTPSRRSHPDDRSGQLDGQSDVVRLSVAALRRRQHRRVHGRRRRDRQATSCTRRPRLPVAGQGDRPEREGHRDRQLGTTAMIGPALRITNHRPTLIILSARFIGSAVYARFRICDDSLKNLTIIETDSRPGKLSYTRRFTTLIAPKPCGVYTRHWTPVARFRGAGRYTVTLQRSRQVRLHQPAGTPQLLPRIALGSTGRPERGAPPDESREQGRQDSNLRHSVLETDALPTELRPSAFARRLYRRPRPASPARE